MQLFLFIYIPNNTTEVLSIDFDLLYTINRVNDKSMSLPNGNQNKMNKREYFHEKFIISENI